MVGKLTSLSRSLLLALFLGFSSAAAAENAPASEPPQAISAISIPEPSTVALLVAGTLVLQFKRWKSGVRRTSLGRGWWIPQR